MQKTEMMKRYETETGKDRPTVNIYSLIDWYEAFSAWLESQLTWRPVSDKPKESDRYLVKYRQGKIVKKFIADYDVVYGWNISLPDVEILEYLPIPPPPEEKNE